MCITCKHLWTLLMCSSFVLCSLYRMSTWKKTLCHCGIWLFYFHTCTHLTFSLGGWKFWILFSSSYRYRWSLESCMSHLLLHSFCCFLVDWLTHVSLCLLLLQCTNQQDGWQPFFSRTLNTMCMQIKPPFWHVMYCSEM